MNKKETLKKLISLATSLRIQSNEKELAEKIYKQAAQELEKTKQAIGELVVDYNNHVYNKATVNVFADIEAELLPYEFTTSYHFIEIDCDDDITVNISEKPESLYTLQRQIEFQEEQQGRTDESELSAGNNSASVTPA